MLRLTREACAEEDARRLDEARDGREGQEKRQGQVVDQIQTEPDHGEVDGNEERGFLL